MNTKTEVIAYELETLIAQFEEKKYSHSNEKLKSLLEENEIINFNQITHTECHVIECIANINEPNGIIIAEKLNMTRGGISKIANRLIEKKLIITYQNETNQKKIFYKLTPFGEKVNIIHSNLHKEKHNFLLKIASKYTSQEQDVIIRFIKDLQNNNE